MDEKYQAAITQAEKYKDMADKILLGRFKEKYYKLGIEALANLETSDETVSEMRQKLEIGLNEARARIVIEKYEFACKSREYAKTSEDLGSAALHYTEAVDARKKVCVDRLLLSPEMTAAYDETEDAENQAAVLRKKSTKTYQIGRLRLLSIVGLVVLLLAGVGLNYHTAGFQALLGKTQMKLGMYDKAIQNLRAQAKKGDKTIDSLYTEAEIYQLKESQPGEVVWFGGTKWILVDHTDGIATMVCQSSMEEGPYQLEGTIDWSKSLLREKLNTEYLQREFTEAELECICITDIETENGVGTEDRVYLFSKEEYEAYAPFINHSNRNTWLRSIGEREGSVCYVDVTGVPMTYGYDPSTDVFTVKPVIRVEIKNDK